MQNVKLEMFAVAIPVPERSSLGLLTFAGLLLPLACRRKARVRSVLA